MRVIEALTEQAICSHCRRPWVVFGDFNNGCCPEDGHDLVPPATATAPGLQPVTSTKDDPIIDILEFCQEPGPNPRVYLFAHRIVVEFGDTRFGLEEGYCCILRDHMRRFEFPPEDEEDEGTELAAALSYDADPKEIGL